MIQMIVNIESWLLKFKFQIYKHLSPGAIDVNSQNTAISMKHIHVIDKIKLVLYPQSRNSITMLKLSVWILIDDSTVQKNLHIR